MLLHLIYGTLCDQKSVLTISRILYYIHLAYANPLYKLKAIPKELIESFKLFKYIKSKYIPLSFYSSFLTIEIEMVIAEAIYVHITILHVLVK